jgi:ribosomal protein S12
MLRRLVSPNIVTNAARVPATPCISSLTSQLRQMSVTQNAHAHLFLKPGKIRLSKIVHPGHLNHRQRTFGFDELELARSVEFREGRNYRMNAERSRLRVPDWKRRRLMNDRGFITGVVLKVYTVKPKKPNSANRKVCKVRLANQWPKKGMETIAYIPYENHNVTEHSKVFLYYHPKKDLVGIKLRVIRGVYDVSARPPRKYKGLKYSNLNTVIQKYSLEPNDRRSERYQKLMEDYVEEKVPDIYNYL